MNCACSPALCEKAWKLCQTAPVLSCPSPAPFQHPQRSNRSTVNCNVCFAHPNRLLCLSSDCCCLGKRALTAWSWMQGLSASKPLSMTLRQMINHEAQLEGLKQQQQQQQVRHAIRQSPGALSNQDKPEHKKCQQDFVQPQLASA